MAICPVDEYPTRLVGDGQTEAGALLDRDVVFASLQPRVPVLRMLGAVSSALGYRYLSGIIGV